LPLACRLDPGTHFTDEGERTLDLPKHGTARVWPWLSMALVAGPVRRGRGADRCNNDIVKVKGEDPATPGPLIKGMTPGP